MNGTHYLLAIFVVVLAAGVALPNLLFVSLSVSPAGRFTALAVDGCREGLIRASCSLASQPSFTVGPPESKVICSLSNGEERIYPLNQYASSPASFSFNDGGEGTCRPEYDTEYLWFCANGPYDKATGNCPGGSIGSYPSTTLIGASCCVPRIPPTCNIPRPIMPQGGTLSSGSAAGGIGAPPITSVPPVGGPAPPTGAPSPPAGFPTTPAAADPAAAWASMVQPEQCGPLLDNPQTKTYDIQCCSPATQTCKANPASRFGKSCVDKGRVCGTGQGEICQGYEKAKCNPRQLVQKTPDGAIREKWEYKEDTTECPSEIFGQDTDGDSVVDRQQAGAGCYCEPKVCCLCLYQETKPDCKQVATFYSQEEVKEKCESFPTCVWKETGSDKCTGTFSCAEMSAEEQCIILGGGKCLWDKKANICSEYFKFSCDRWTEKEGQAVCDTRPIPIRPEPESAEAAFSNPGIFYAGDGCTYMQVARMGHGSNEEKCDPTFGKVRFCIYMNPEIDKLVFIDRGCSIGKDKTVVNKKAEELRQELRELAESGKINPDFDVIVAVNQGPAGGMDTCTSLEAYDITASGTLVMAAPCHSAGSPCNDKTGVPVDCTENGQPAKQICCESALSAGLGFWVGQWNSGISCS